MDIPKIFKPENCDLTMYPPAMDIRACWAAKAQSIFEEYLRKNGRVVYGPYVTTGLSMSETLNPANDTHTALLINIQEIEKKECEQHEPMHRRPECDDKICMYCGKKLKANWSVVE